MAKFPDPPGAEALTRSNPEQLVIEAGTRLWRIYASSGEHAAAWNALRSFGPTDARFDHQRPPPHHDRNRALCYLGVLAPLCVAERFQGHRRIERHAGTPRLVGFDLARPIRLLDLRGLWPTRLGASQAVAVGTRSRSRRWAVALYEALGADVDGLCYRSSMYGGEAAVVLWEPGRTALPESPVLDISLDDPRLTLALARTCLDLGYTMS
ncbi:MAG: RES family NAD+ phosphorylase [Acidimicrobiales bacterium]